MFKKMAIALVFFLVSIQTWSDESGFIEIPAIGEGEVIVNLKNDQKYTCKSFTIAKPTTEDSNQWMFSSIFYTDKATKKDYSIYFIISNIVEKPTFVMAGLNYGGQDYYAINTAEGAENPMELENLNELIFAPEMNGDIYTVNFSFSEDTKFYKDGDKSKTAITVKYPSQIRFTGKK